jgi:hypothetical protein
VLSFESQFLDQQGDVEKSAKKLHLKIDIDKEGFYSQARAKIGHSSALIAT